MGLVRLYAQRLLAWPTDPREQNRSIFHLVMSTTMMKPTTRSVQATGRITRTNCKITELRGFLYSAIRADYDQR